MWVDILSCESNHDPKFLTEGFASIVSSPTAMLVTLTFASCCLVRICFSTTSVLSSLSFKRSLTIQSLKHLIQLLMALKAASSSPGWFGLNATHIQLRIIRVAMNAREVLLYNLEHLTGVDCEQDRTKTAPLWDSLLQRKRRRETTIHRDLLTSARIYNINSIARACLILLLSTLMTSAN